MAYLAEVINSSTSSATTPFIQENPLSGIVQLCLDHLLLIAYTVQYLYYYGLMMIDLRCKQRWVFSSPNSQILCTTSNFAKYRDLPSYIHYKHNPYSFADKVEIVKKRGFTPQQTEFTPYPFNEGHCFGNAVIFCKTWLENRENPSKLIEEFNGGSSLMGAIYQEAYEEEQFYISTCYPAAVRRIEEIIHKYPLISFIEQKKLWVKIPEGEMILNALEGYLKEKHHPRHGDFIEEMTKRCGDKLNEVTLTTFREVAGKYTQNLNEEEKIRAIFESAGMEIERFYHMDSTVSDVLNTVRTLTEMGVYKLSFPCYGVWGQKIGTHTISFGIGTTSCCILDNNVALGSCAPEDLYATVGRIIGLYNGMDYSKTAEGEWPSGETMLCNLFCERSNPPLDGPAKEYDLYKIALRVATP